MHLDGAVWCGDLYVVDTCHVRRVDDGRTVHVIRTADDLPGEGANEDGTFRFYGEGLTGRSRNRIDGRALRSLRGVLCRHDHIAGTIAYTLGIGEHDIEDTVQLTTVLMVVLTDLTFLFDAVLIPLIGNELQFVRHIRQGTVARVIIHEDDAVVLAIDVSAETDVEVHSVATTETSTGFGLIGISYLHIQVTIAFTYIRHVIENDGPGCGDDTCRIGMPHVLRQVGRVLDIEDVGQSGGLS